MDSIADLIDKLSIVNNKIFKLEDIKRDANASDKTIADATRSTNALNSIRIELKTEINGYFGDHNEEIKTYGKGTD